MAGPETPLFAEMWARERQTVADQVTAGIAAHADGEDHRRPRGLAVLGAEFTGGGAAAGGWALIYDHTVGVGGESFIDTGALDQTGQTLVLELSVRSTQAGTGLDRVNIQVNGDTGTHYNYQELKVSDATVSGAAWTGNNEWQLGNCPSAGAGAGVFGHIIAWLPLYAVSDRKPTYSAQNATLYDVADSSTWYESSGGVLLGTGTTTNIGSIQFDMHFGDFAEGTRLRIWKVG